MSRLCPFPVSCFTSTPNDSALCVPASEGEGGEGPPILVSITGRSPLGQGIFGAGGCTNTSALFSLGGDLLEE